VNRVAVVRLESSDGAAVNRLLRRSDADVVLFAPNGVVLADDVAARHLHAHRQAGKAAFFLERIHEISTPLARYMTMRTNGPGGVDGDAAPWLRWLPVASAPRAAVLDAGGLSEDQRLAPVVLLDLETRLRARGLRIATWIDGGAAAPLLADLHAVTTLAKRIGAALPALYELHPSSVRFTGLPTLLACAVNADRTAASVNSLIADEAKWLNPATSLDDVLLHSLTSGWHRVVIESLAAGAQSAWPEATALRRRFPERGPEHGGAPSVQLGSPRQVRGVRIIPADAVTEPLVVAGRNAEQIRRGGTGGRHLYAVIDHSPTDDAPVAIEIEYLDTGRCFWTLQYDSHDGAVCFAPERPGAFKTAAPAVTHADTGVWRAARFVLDDWRFERACHGADIRIVVDAGSTDDPIVASITVTPASAAPAAPEEDGLRGIEPLELASSATPAVSIVIPVHDRLAYTAACLGALAGSTRLRFEVIVVDNGSTDGTGEFVSRCRGVRRIERADNGGFAVACNAGAQAAQAEVIVFLNNDTLPVAGWLDALHDTLTSHPDVAIAGAKLLFATQDARVQHAGMWFDGFTPVHRHLFAPAIDPRASTSGPVPAVTGACLAIRREEFLSAGGFDEGFLNGYEDVDLCLRLLERGRATYYCAESVVFHHAGVSAGRFGHETANRARFLERWGPALPALLHGARLHGCT
jgi:GT2 family glycosyltransferase